MTSETSKKQLDILPSRNRPAKFVKKTVCLRCKPAKFRKRPAMVHCALYQTRTKIIRTFVRKIEIQLHEPINKLQLAWLYSSYPPQNQTTLDSFEKMISTKYFHLCHCHRPPQHLYKYFLSQPLLKNDPWWQFEYF